ncbi:MAG: polynucleotide adenylyltransferase [Deltaproteobacteria bacterium]|jgi:tRNA nucleotidyltransferase (CCA-adding enzyme)|nr:polynucleotide adenylyltransferase [Deltaproteobacteria bacterium]
MKYYLAGGAVRNLFLGGKPQDLDYVFTGTEENFLALNPGARKLGRNAIYMLGGHEYTPLGEGIEANLLARDFTVNAFLLGEDGVLHMHPEALSDLQAKRLNPASPAGFSLDPLRVFRAARFCSVFPDFKPGAACLDLMAEAAARETFIRISAERVGQECLKALKAPRPGNFLRVLERGRALRYWFKELSGSGRVPAGPPEYHNSSVLEHLAQIMDRAAREFSVWLALRPDITARKAEELVQATVWMALCHDLGKASTPGDMLPHHYQHEIRGIQAAAALASRLRLPARLRGAGALAAKLHMKAGMYRRLRPSTRVDVLTEAQAKGLLEPLFLLAQADSGLSGLLELAGTELKRILEVRLPPHWENLGEKSGLHLRELRCSALSRSSGE